MSPSINSVVEIKYARDGLITLAVLSLAFVLGGVVLALHATDWFHQLIYCLCAAFFGLTTIVIVSRLLSSSVPVVTLSPVGIRDTRIGSEFIPWEAISDIRLWTSPGAAAMVLIVDPRAMKTIRLTLLVRLARWPNFLLGIKGPCVGLNTLKTDHKVLIETTIAYARGHNPNFKQVG
jgi:hypothetical protein